MKPPPPIALSDADRARAIASLRTYAAQELDESLGDLKAGLLLDYVLAEFGPTIYNQAIADARRYMEERAADLDGAHHRVEFPYWGKPKR